MGIQINGNNDTITAIDGSITVGTDLTVPGVLTYDDVTNIDSVGVITARSGLNVTGGSVGIGTDNPGASLQITADSPGILFQDANSGATESKIEGLSGHLYYTTDNLNRDHIFSATDESEALRITGDGNVGIGTDNPSMPLHLSTTEQNAVKWESSNSDGPLTHYYNGTTHLGNVGNSKGVMSSTDLHFGIGSKFDLLFGTKPSGGGSTVERLRITSSGNVGIGLTNPGALLEIHSGGSYGIRGTVESRVGQSKRFIGKWTSGTTHNIAVVDGGTPRGQSRLGGFVVTFTYRSMYGFDGDGGGHGVRMLSGRVRDSGEWGFDTETNSAVGDTPVPTLQGTDNSDGTCTIQLVNSSSTHSFGEFNLIVWDCDIISPST